MKIKNCLKKTDNPSLSFEVFPPKNSSNFESVLSAAEKIASLEPTFMSVTYGAGGGTSEYTLSVASDIQALGVTAIAHLTCVGATADSIEQKLASAEKSGIENILALRGDLPEEYREGEFRHASDLIKFIKSRGDFCVGGACYPEGHPESQNQKHDIENLKLKESAGCDFMTSQMFFDNNIFYNFMYKVRDAGIKVPIIAGIMPVTNSKQIARICKLSGTYLPGKFRQIVDRFGDNQKAMSQAGIAYATEQIIDLFANGINAVHVYSMNNPDVARNIMKNISEILGK